MLRVVMLALVAGVRAQDFGRYCGLCTPGGTSGDQANHTLCLYQGIGGGCTDAMDSRVTKEEKELIIKVHNKLRAWVASGNETRGLAPHGPQPPAANMMAVLWDDELAGIAQAWADQCKFQHDCRHVEDFKVGQNIAQFWNDREAKVQWEEVIQGWYDEVANWSAADTRSFRFTGLEVMTAHFSQLAWGTTRFVGCGRRAFRNGAFYVQHYVCNYGPSGNFWYQPLYDIGQPCTKCPKDSACSDDGVLCEPGRGGRVDSFFHRYAAKAREEDQNVTTSPEDNEVNTDTVANDKRLWEEWYRYLVVGNSQL